MILSERLNNYLKEWYEDHKDVFIFSEEDDFDEEDINGTFLRHKERFNLSGKIHIWTGASENTIYGDPKINWYSRCWHDYIHLTSNNDYSKAGEYNVCKIQCSLLPESWGYERMLLDIEINHQLSHLETHGEFPENQLEFTLKRIKEYDN